MQLCLVFNSTPLAVYRFPASFPVQSILDKVLSSLFFTITRTEQELSVITHETVQLEDATHVESGWVSFKVQGPLDFGLTGILSSLASPLAQAGIPIFAVSTFDTDYILVKQDCADHAKQVLSSFCQIQ